MVVKFKKLTDYVNVNVESPKRAHSTDAGWDLTASTIARHGLKYSIEKVPFKEGEILTYDTGIAVAIPEGYVGLLFPRSSIYKKDLELVNSVGVIDSGYRGPIMFKFRVLKEAGEVYKPGDRVGQLIVMPIGDIFWDETQELPPSDGRDAGGFGSTNNPLDRLSSL